MTLRRYAVTVMDNWTPMRLFWTLRGACRHRKNFGSEAHLFVWRGEWIEILKP